MPSVIGIPSFKPRTAFASCGAAKPCVATNSPDSASSRLRLVKTAMWAWMSFPDHARYASTPALFPDINRMYFMSLAPFTLPFWRVHRVVGAAFPVLDILGKFFVQENLAVRCRFKAPAPTYLWRRNKNDYRIRSSGRQPGLGGSMRPPGTIHGNSVR